jgi:hypothetical protein
MSVTMNIELQRQYQLFATKCGFNRERLRCILQDTYAVGETQNPTKGKIATISVLMERRAEFIKVNKNQPEVKIERYKVDVIVSPHNLQLIEALFDFFEETPNPLPRRFDYVAVNLQEIYPRKVFFPEDIAN